MAGIFVTQDKSILYVQPDGAFTAMKPLSIDKHGMADKTMPGTGRNVVWGRDEFSRFVNKVSPLAPPSGLNTSTVEEDDLGTYSFLSKMYDRVGCFPLQERWYRCGRLDGPAWTRILHYGRMTITGKTGGAGPSREASAAVMFNTFDVTWPYSIELHQHALSALTIAEDQDIYAIAVLSDLVVGCNTCLPGYSPDTIVYVGPAANTGSPGDYANVWYSTNAGGTFAVTSANPFAAGEGISFLLVNFINDTQYRLIAISDQTTDQMNYADITLGAEGTTVWNGAIAVGAAVVDAAAWLFYDRIYLSVDGDIYLSTDQGASVTAAIYTGTPLLYAFAKSPVDGSVFAAGASNTILQEVGQSGAFSAKVGPTGGTTFRSLFVANDGTLLAGNGQYLYRSNNSALNAGGWEVLHDFGANQIIRTINCAGGTKSQGGDSQLIRCVIDNTSTNVGAVWESADGGTTWQQVDALTNTGYLSSYFSPVDDNLAWIVGNAGVVQKLTAKAI